MFDRKNERNADSQPLLDLKISGLGSESSFSSLILDFFMIFCLDLFDYLIHLIKTRKFNATKAQKINK